MPGNPYELSRQFLKLCSSETQKKKLLTDTRFCGMVAELMTSDQEEILLPTLLGLRKLSLDSAGLAMLSSDDVILKYLNNLSKRCLGNDQIKPIIRDILDLLSKKDNSLNSSSINRKFNSRVQVFGNTKNPQSRTEFTTFKYSIAVPGVGFIQTRKQVEKLLVKIKGIKSFQIDAGKEIVDLYTRPNFRLSFVAKVLAAHAQIDDIYWVRSENGVDQRTKVTYEENDLDSSIFSCEDFSMMNDRMLVNLTKNNEEVSWSNAIGNFFAKAFYW